MSFATDELERWISAVFKNSVPPSPQRVFLDDDGTSWTVVRLSYIDAAFLKQNCDGSMQTYEHPTVHDMEAEDGPLVIHFHAIDADEILITQSDAVTSSFIPLNIKTQRTVRFLSLAAQPSTAD